jgi:hypothetical protein
MVAAMPLGLTDAEDQHVVLGGMAWQDYEAFLAIRGDRAGVRMYYLDGQIEILSPARTTKPTRRRSRVCSRSGR